MVRKTVILALVLLLLPGDAPGEGEVGSPGISEKLFLHFKWESFDPLEGPGREVEKLSFTPDSLVVVQLPSPPTPGARGMLERSGYTPLLYQPDFAYICLEGPRAAPREDFRAVYPLKAYLRASPDLISSYLAGEDETITLFILFPFPAPSSVLRLSRLGFVKEAGADYCTLRASAVRLKEILKTPYVLWVEELHGVELDNDVASDIIDVKEISSGLNLTGRGVIVAVADTGLDNGRNDQSMHPDFRGRIRAAHAWGRSGNWSDADIHVNNSGVISYRGGHGTHVAGSVLGNGTAGNITGMAPEAYLVIQSLMTSTGSLSVPSNYSSLYSQAYSDGARIHTNSWSTRATSTYGNYTTRSYYIDYYSWLRKNFTILYSAGNQQSYGNGSVSTQATAKNCIAVGASENYRPTLGSAADNISQLAYFSSLGPTDDGRIKPDVVAPGTWILSTRSTLITDPWNHYWGSQSLYNSLNSYYAYMGGTSMSTPITAGAVALLRQYMVEREGHQPSSALLKALLINGARPLNGQLSSVPNNREGWGRINLTLSLAAEDDMKLTWVDYSAGLNTSSTFTKRIVVQNSSTPLFITLVWTDFPSSPTSSRALVNDLDLEVVLPNGTVHYGNDFSSPFNTSRDRRNNVERVHLLAPPPGIYTIRVRGYSVPHGPQPFALAITANTTDAVGSLEWDKPFYRVGDWGALRLSDSNLTGRGWIRLFVNSTSYPAGVWVNLTENTTGGSQGIFEGRVKLVSNTPGAGELKALDNDTVTAYYNESYPRRLLKASVKAYLQPVINWVNHTAWNYTLTWGENTTILINGTPGRVAMVYIRNLSGGVVLNLYDDGQHGDGGSGDGLYGALYTVPQGDYIEGNFTLEGHLRREPLPDTVAYSTHPLRIDTTMPLRPSWLNVTPLPQGNSLLLTWEAVSDPNLLSYRIYRNSTSGGFVPLHETLNTTPSFVDRGLVDGLRYTYYVVSKNLWGKLSRASPMASGVPRDILPPSLEILSPSPGEVLRGSSVINFTASPDTIWVALDIYRDLNSNGQSDDGGVWFEAVNESLPADRLILNTTALPEGFEGAPLLMRLRGADEAGNPGKSPAVANITVDNTPPQWAQIFPGREVLTSSGEVTLTVLAEPSARIEVSSNRSYLSFSYSEVSPGNYTLHLALLPGSTQIFILLYDHAGNGPYRGGPLTVHYDSTPPICTLAVECSNTTGGLKVRSTSRDEQVISNASLVGLAEIRWNVSYGGEYFEGVGESFTLPAPQPGWAWVRLTVRDLFGNSNTTTLKVRVNDTTPPTLPPLGPYTFEEDRRFTLSAEGTLDNDPSFFSSAQFLWNISGEHLSGFYVSHVIRDPGEYRATLTAVDPSGNANSTTFTIIIQDTTPPEIVLDIPGEIRAGRITTLSALQTRDNNPGFTPGENILWEIVEIGLEGRGGTFNVTFPRKGSYTLKVSVTDPAGNNATLTQALTVLCDGTPPAVLKVERRERRGFLDPETSFLIHLSEPLSPPPKGSVKIYAGGKAVDLSLRLSPDGLLLNATPLHPLPLGATVRLSLTGALEDLTGTPLEPVTFNFTVWGSLRVVSITPGSVTSPGEIRITLSNEIASAGGAALILGEEESALTWDIDGRNITIEVRETPPGEGVVVVHDILDVFGQRMGSLEVPYMVSENLTGGGGGEGAGGIIYIYLFPIIIVALALVVLVALNRRKKV